jgi:hypothetical protein
MPFTHRRVANTVGIVLTLIAIIALLFSWHASVEEGKANRRLEAYVQCQADWTSFLLTAIQSNRASTSDANDALDNLIKSISSSTTPDQSRAALAAYQEARAKQKLTQEKNPLPPPPETICKLEDK